ncbi:MAG TPA: ABC transporter ATP-binding protein [Candidatus Dormibacteraeota bacterium]
MTAVLEARSLYRFFHAGDEETLALQGVSLTVNAGEVLAVTGPSGSGKSTLLACLAGLDEPDGGTVWVAGERVSRRPEAERAALRRRAIGILFQSGNLLDHLTVRDNLVLVQRLARRPDPARVDALLDQVGLGPRRAAHPSELSGGELARAGLAVALANDPGLVLADEPSAEVDAAAEEGLLRLLLDVAGGGAAVVLVTHSPAVAATAHRTVAMRDGRVEA